LQFDDERIGEALGKFMSSVMPPWACRSTGVAALGCGYLLRGAKSAADTFVIEWLLRQFKLRGSIG
jgi:hypothetical protein